MSNSTFSRFVTNKEQLRPTLLRPPSVSSKFSSSKSSFHSSCRISFFICSFQAGLPRSALRVNFTRGSHVAKVLPAVAGKCRTLGRRSSPTHPRLANTRCLRKGNTVIIELHSPAFTLWVIPQKSCLVSFCKISGEESRFDQNIHQFMWRPSPSFGCYCLTSPGRL